MSLQPAFAPDIPRPIVCLCANTARYMATYRARLITMLIEEGWRVLVLSRRDRHVDTLARLGAEHVELDLESAGHHPTLEAKAYVAARREMIRLRPSVVLTFAAHANVFMSLAAQRLGIPTICTVLGPALDSSERGLREHIARLLNRKALKAASTVIFERASDHLGYVHADLVVPEHACTLRGAGIDLERYSPRPKPLPGAFRFLLVARPLSDPGVEAFVDAARIVNRCMSDVEFAIVGFLDDENTSADARARVTAWEHEGLITYQGGVNDMVPVHAQADCVVLPAREREGVPRALLEAAAMGRPVITSDVPGCRDAVMNSVTGLLVRPGDVQHLAERMIEMATLGAVKYKKMSVAARLFACAQFDETKVLEVYRAAVHAVTGGVDAGVPAPTEAHTSAAESSAQPRSSHDITMG